MDARRLTALVAAVTAGLLIGAWPTLQAQARRPAPPKAQAPAKAPPKAAPRATPTIGVAGLQVVGRSAGKSRFGDLVAFNGSPGMKVALLVKVPTGTALLDIDDDESVIESWQDDKTTDLNIEPDFDFSPDYNDDRTAAITDVETAALPAAGAQQVTLAGALAITTASGTRTVSARKVALTAGTTFKAGTLAGTVESAEASDESTSVTLRYTAADGQSVKGVKFLDPAGTELESDYNGTSWSSESREYTYTIKSKAAAATLEIEQWLNVATAKVPFSVTVGLGSVREP